MISLIHPSRGRAMKSRETFHKWKKAGVWCDGWPEHIVSVDLDDIQLNAYINLHGDKVIANQNTSVVEATNAAAKQSTGNILVYLSDDFNCPEDWNLLIEKEFEGVTKPMILKVDDCLQKFDVGVLTIPIMNRALYKLLGYFFHPSYKSMHVDVDLYETTKKFIKYCPHLKFPHDHHSVGKCENDETYRRSEANWDQGLQVIKQRRRQGFPL